MSAQFNLYDNQQVLLWVFFKYIKSSHLIHTEYLYNQVNNYICWAGYNSLHSSKEGNRKL